MQTAEAIRRDILTALGQGDAMVPEIRGRCGRYDIESEVFCNGVHLDSARSAVITCEPQAQARVIIVNGVECTYYRCRHIIRRELTDQDVLLAVRQLRSEGLVEQVTKTDYPWRHGQYWRLTSTANAGLALAEPT